MRILAIETSSSAASCAILNESKLEAEIYINHKLQHSVILFPMLEKILNMVDLTIDDIDAVAVSRGPGSFTGLRIGISAAKGIAQGGNKKFVAISGLDAIAFQQVGFEGIICPMMDALRDNVYTALYQWKNGMLKIVYEYNALHIDELIQVLVEKGEKVIFCGDAVEIHRAKLSQVSELAVQFAANSLTMPKASSIAELAQININNGIEDNIFTFSPIYLRKSQAEREYERKYGEIID